MEAASGLLPDQTIDEGTMKTTANTRMRLAGLALATVMLAACAAGSQQLGSSGAPAPASTAAARAAMAAAPAGGQAADQAAQTSTVPSPTDTGQRLIVKDGSLTLQVDDVGASAAQIRQLAETLGGFVVTSTEREDNGRPAATVTIRVPAERFDEAMGQLKGIAQRVNSEQISSKDITDEYVDVEARLRNLRATEQTYIGLLGQARTVDDVLKIQQQLSNVRGQIEQLQGRLQYLEKSAALSSITVELRLPAAAQGPVPAEFALQPIFRTAVAALTITLQFLAGVVIFGFVFAPIWIPLALLVRWLRRRSTPVAPAAA
jgi:hypothetical protein